MDDQQIKQPIQGSSTPSNVVSSLDNNDNQTNASIHPKPFDTKKEISSPPPASRFGSFPGGGSTLQAKAKDADQEN